MSEEELVELLDIHADSLKEDVDLTRELLVAEPAETHRVLEPLMLLARRVKAALRPVEPGRDFVADLKAQLKATARQTQALTARRKEAKKRHLIWMAAGLGGLVYFVGMAVLSLRLSLAFLSFMAGVLGWRMVRTPPPKTRIAH